MTDRDTDRRCANCNGTMVGRTRKATYCCRDCQVAAYRTGTPVYRVYLDPAEDAVIVRTAAAVGMEPGAYLARLVEAHVADLTEDR